MAAGNERCRNAKHGDATSEGRVWEGRATQAAVNDGCRGGWDVPMRAKAACNAICSRASVWVTFLGEGLASGREETYLECV